MGPLMLVFWSHGSSSCVSRGPKTNEPAEEMCYMHLSRVQTYPAGFHGIIPHQAGKHEVIVSAFLIIQVFPAESLHKKPFSQVLPCPRTLAVGNDWPARVRARSGGLPRFRMNLSGGLQVLKGNGPWLIGKPGETGGISSVNNKTIQVIPKTQSTTGWQFQLRMLISQVGKSFHGGRPRSEQVL